MKKVLAIALMAFVVSPLPAFSYIDPGSGSVIMSAVIGFFVATAMVVKTYWYKLKSIFTGKQAPLVEEDPQEESKNA